MNTTIRYILWALALLASLEVMARLILACRPRSPVSAGSGPGVAIVGALEPGAVAHRLAWHSATEFQPNGQAINHIRYTAACSGQDATTCSWSWAESHGAFACITCFGGIR